MFERFSQDAVKALRGRELGIATLGILLLLIVIAPPLRTALLAEGAWLVYMVSALGLLCLIAAGVLLYRMLACAQAKPYRDLIASSADPEAARRALEQRMTGSGFYVGEDYVLYHEGAVNFAARTQDVLWVWQQDVFGSQPALHFGLANGKTQGVFLQAERIDAVIRKLKDIKPDLLVDYTEDNKQKYRDLTAK